MYIAQVTTNGVSTLWRTLYSDRPGLAARMAAHFGRPVQVDWVDSVAPDRAHEFESVPMLELTLQYHAKNQLGHLLEEQLPELRRFSSRMLELIEAVPAEQVPVGVGVLSDALTEVVHWIDGRASTSRADARADGGESQAESGPPANFR